MKQTYTTLLAFALQLCFFNSINAQQRLLRGHVLVEGEKEGAVGVTIRVVGQSRGAMTDLDGNFQLMVTEEDRLSFTYTGCAPATYTVLDVAELNHEIILIDGTLLPEVVITGTKITKQSVSYGCLVINSCPMQSAALQQEERNQDELSISLDKTWSYYPNPTVEGIMVSTEEQTGYIDVFSTDGRLVGRTLVTDINTKVPMTELPAGTYLLLYENADWQSVIGKVVKAGL